MEIDRSTLIKILEAFANTTEVVQRELMLYQMLFSSACKTRGLDEIQTEKAVEQGREVLSPTITAACREGYLAHQAKIPLLVDMLESRKDEAFRLLKEWTPKGPPN